MSNSTLFIPDISGFTKFVKSTEINHGKHIIEELINIIISEGKKEFEVAEVEGDAVFFYKKGIVSPEVLINQAKKIFVAFHKHLLDYEHNRICECGACTTAVNLRLKFITHAGDISLAHYGTGNAKPYGDAVIAVHRLLKNSIAADQYVLFTDDFLAESNLQLDGEGTLNDESLGKIPFKFLDINHWKADVVINKKELKKTDVDLEVSASKEIPMDSLTLHKLISEFKYRSLWNKEADEIIYKEDEINQNGSEHFCVVNGKDLLFDTIKPEYDAGLAYGEILKNPAPFKYLENDFYVKDVSSNLAQLKVTLRVSLKWQWQKILIPLFKKKMTAQLQKIIQSIETAAKEIPRNELAA